MNVKSEKTFKMLSAVVTCIYFILLIWVIMFKCNLEQSITDTYLFFKEMTLKERINFHLIPFMDYVEGPFVSHIKTIIEDDILNILFFVPLGMYIGLFSKKHKFLKIFLIALSLSVFFEVFQLFSLIGSFSTKDVITNVSGSIIGYIIYKIVYKEENSERKIKILSITSIVVIFVFSMITFYAIFNTIKNIDLYINILLRRI